MDHQLFGGESSEEEEEEESSEESSAEDGAQEQESGGGSSSSSESEGGEVSAQQQATPIPAPSLHDRGSPEPTDELTNQDDTAESQMPNTQDLFGDSSSDSTSGSEEEEEEEEPKSASPEAPVVSPLASPMEGAESPSSVAVETRGGEPQSQLATTPPAENGVPLVVKEPSQTVEGIFGEDADLSSSDEEMETGQQSQGDTMAPAADIGEGGEGGESGEELPPPEEEFPRINVEIPRCVAHLGSEAHFVKLPNFLSVETRPFDPDLFEDEGEEDDLLDEEGRARLKLKVENTIRWRYSQDEGGNEIRESNARVVKWTDGSMSLYLGGEIFDIYKQPLQGEFSHLFVRQGTGLQGQAVFRTKLTFRPHSTDSQTHRKMTLSIADRFSKAQKIRIIPTAGRDPESERTSKIKVCAISSSPCECV